MVTWHEAALFCNMLSGNDQLPECYACDGQVCQPSDEYATPSDCPGYRLPTEAEWEYAARATTSDATYRGDIASGDLECAETNPVLDGIAWYCGNSSGSTHQVASGEANVWGLYDMLGNVSEWCQDWFTDTPDELTTDPWGPPNGAQRVIRGGAWSDDARDQRAASRRGLVPSRRDFVGVRPVRSVSFSAISLE
jgi:formylglycine-generating enzyme required for sulfatase activity